MADTILRFTNSDATVVRLDLNNRDSGWYLTRGLDLGGKQVKRTYLSSADVDGAVLAVSSYEVTPMRIPLLMARPSGTQQQVAEAMKALMDALELELERKTNTIEYRPRGLTVSYLIDTYRSDVPSLLQGVDIPDPFALGEAGRPMVLSIDREPDMRGAGTNI